MNITRWEPFREMKDMFRQHSPFFTRALRREGGEGAAWSPVADITETDKEYLMCHDGYCYRGRGRSVIGSLNYRW